MTRQVRVGVVGSGYWGRNLVRNFHGLGALHGLCDSDEAARTTMQDIVQVPVCTGDYRELLECPEIDAVALATPAGLHGAMVREALDAGKDVFVEKPLCLSESEGAALVARAAELDRVLMVGHLLWYHAGIQKLKSLVADGELGRVQYVYSNRLNMGKLRREENVLWSFAPHDVSIILGLVGEEPVRVQASGGNYLHRDIADTTVSLLEFASGVRAHIFVSWLHPFKEQKLVVVGERKMAVFDDTAPWGEKLLLYPHSVGWEGNVPVARKADAQAVALEESEPLRAECAHFLECVATRSAPRTDGAEGLRVLRVLRACQAALESGATVSLDTPERDWFAHDTAVVDEGVRVGTGTRIWHFSHLLSGTVVGEGCTIGQNVMIGPDVSVGARCKIQNNVSLYKGVTLEEGVFCGPSCVFTNVNNPRAEIERKDEYRLTSVKRGATIGANATIVCGYTLGRYCFIAAGAVVASNVPDFALMAGVPARRIGWMSRAGARLGSDLVCPLDGRRYRESGPDTLVELDS